MTPLVWIFLAIISVLVLMIVLIGLVLRARCSKSSRQKAKFVRAGDQQHNTLLKEDRVNSRGNNPDLIPDTGQSTWAFYYYTIHSVVLVYNIEIKYLSLPIITTSLWSDVSM